MGEGAQIKESRIKKNTRKSKKRKEHMDKRKAFSFSFFFLVKGEGG